MTAKLSEAQALVARLVGVYGDWPFPQERTDECVRWFRRLPKALGEGVVDRFTQVYDEVPKNIVKALDRIRVQVDEHGDFRLLMDKIRRTALDALRFRRAHYVDGDVWTLRRILEGMRAELDEEIAATHADWAIQRRRACEALLLEMNDPSGGQHHYPVSSEEARDAEQQAMKGIA